VPTLLSINRFENKKQLTLALRAFGTLVRSRQLSNIRLVIAGKSVSMGTAVIVLLRQASGGYDPRLVDNVVTLVALQELAASLSLSHYTYSASAPAAHLGGPKISSSSPPPNTQVLFVTNLSHSQKLHLLRSTSTKALLYTPENEHLGIVPLEAMACGLPVLACNRGGPVETVLDTGLPEPATQDTNSAILVGTGLLRQPDPDDWAEAMQALLSLSPPARQLMSTAGKKRVSEMFSLQAMSTRLEKALKEATESKERIWQEEHFLLLLIGTGLSLVIFGAGLYSSRG
jgi:alpha-1,3/alpha-1,6-mannosyltransferase